MLVNRNRLIAALMLLSLPLIAQGQASQQNSARAPEATVILNEQFFNSFLEAIFSNLKAPSTPLIITPGDREATSSSSSAGCPSIITLERQNGSVRTEVKLDHGRIVAPLVFSGSYNSSLLSCLQFRGWANTEWFLDFDRVAQVLRATIKLTDLRLENVPAMLQGSLTGIVQSVLDQQINPLQILRVEQVSGVVPVEPAGGSLRLRAKEITPTVSTGVLHLRISYEFLPAQGQQSR